MKQSITPEKRFRIQLQMGGVYVFTGLAVAVCVVAGTWWPMAGFLPGLLAGMWFTGIEDIHA